MDILKHKKTIYLVLLIEIFGLLVIFFQTSINNRILQQDRENYFIVTDINNKDVLKIEKRYLSSESIEKIQFTKVGVDKIFTINDKKLIQDIMSVVELNKFKNDNSLPLGTEDITLYIKSPSHSISLVLYAEDKTGLIKYEDSSFIVTFTDDFYNLIYNLYEKATM